MTLSHQPPESSRPYLARLQSAFVTDLREHGQGTISATIQRHGLTPPPGFDTRHHSGVVRSLCRDGMIVAVRVDRSASPTAHSGFVTRWALVGAKP